ncbi:hypothetical protein JF531_07730 [Microbacterium esteraromaticum]|uniref:YobI family P-loop NTPase n=1 Tax=Microbacterium esteraromaticum TaxID=57043 RepID=UPI001A909F5A|nr:hypothetical protein [Microbacterium esteraromaticum]MBN8424410.1 hypothetical protein [Microbacterium esteraromaticum]
MPGESDTKTRVDGGAPMLTSLAPEYSDANHSVYLAVLKRAIDDQPMVRNIALSGTYGTGKSSILHQLHREYDGRVVELSLLTLGAKPDEVEPSDDMNPAAGTTTNRIQKEIVKQLLYQQRPTDAPESRFRRISRFRWKPELLIASAAVLIGVTAAALFGFDVTTTPSLRIVFAPREPWVLSIAGYLTAGALIAAIVFAARSLIRGRAAIEKVNAGPATITLPPRSSSYFDEYLDEIIYFFEMNARIDIVIIEDLDRFNDPHIFEALRSLNSLLNAARQLAPRNIRFIYAVRDSVFAKLGRDDEDVKTDEARAELARANRTKFFELIIPVVPFITHKNARDLMHQLLTERGHAISKELVNLSARHLADMRLVQNIVNEFEIFRHRLLDVPDPVPELDADHLFAMVVFKNAHMPDFEAIRLGKSTLDRLWDLWRDLVKQNIDRLERENERRLRGITNRDAAGRHARQLGTRLRITLDALYSAPGTSLASPAVTHAGKAVDDAVLESPRFWRQFIESKKPLVLEVHRTGTWSTGPMNLDQAAVEALTSLKINADQFMGEASAADRERIARNEEALTFLRRHSWESLAERSSFAHGVLHGEEAVFRDWIEELLPSKLAADLVVNGYINQYFSLHVSAFYGQLIRPDAMIYVMRCVDVGVADAEYPLDADDVEAIIRDQGQAVLLERSMLNVSILNHLLRDRRRDAVKVVGNLSIFDEKGTFLARYFSVGTEKPALVELLTPLDADVFHWLAARASLSDVERVALIDVAARHRESGIAYRFPAELRQLLEHRYMGLPTLTLGTDIDGVRQVVALFTASDAIVDDLTRLPHTSVAEFRSSRAYAMTHSNLEALTGGDNLSLDILKNTNEEALSYAVDEISQYLAVIRDSPSTTYTVESQSLFASTLKAADEWSSATFAEFIQKASAACTVNTLADYPVPSWDALARFQRIPMTLSNVQTYLDEHGQVTDSLAVSLESAERISEIEESEHSERVKVALAILNSTATSLSIDARVKLALSLEPGELDVNDVRPLRGDLIGELINEELIADDEDAFSSRLMVDWPTQAHAMWCSTRFEGFVGPATLQPAFVKDVFGDDRFRDLWPDIVQALGAYTQPLPGAFEALAQRVVAGEVDIDGDVIELARSRGLAEDRVIELLALSEARVALEQLVAVLSRLGGVWSKVSKRGFGSHPVTDSPGAERVLARLQRGEIVSSMPREGRGFKVSPKQPPRN